MGLTTAKITRGALLAAISFILLLIAAGSPGAKLSLTAIAGLVTAYAVIRCGIGVSWCVYLVAGALGLLLAPDKTCALLYVGFLGYYPILKSLIERLKNRVAVWGCKLFVFLAAFNIFWFAAGSVVAQFVSGTKNILIFANLVSLAVYIVYDIGMTRLIGCYLGRVAYRGKEGGRT